MTTKHPAKYSLPIQDILKGELADCRAVYDPMAGVGTIHRLVSPGSESFGTEIELEWASQHPKTIHSNLFDCVSLFGIERFDAICTSPCYGNRMADHHEARDASKRNTYRHKLGRPLSVGSSAGLQWGEKYREFHLKAWQELERTLKPGGKFVLNVSNFLKLKVEQDVTAFHVAALSALGLTVEKKIQVETSRMRYGANREKRVKFENIIVFRKGLPDPRIS